MNYSIKTERIFLSNIREKNKLERFLEAEGISLDKNLEYTLGAYEGETLVAAGSFLKNTLRSLAVKSSHQGMGILNKIISELMQEQFTRGYQHIFLYTKGDAVPFFEDLGFYKIVNVENKLVFMENKKDGIKEFVNKLKENRIEGDSAAIVMNGNPFTLGHRFLVEKAAMENQRVHLFVVSEEASVIPYSVRYKLIRDGIKDLKNVFVHNSGDYIISNATFPSYFIKEDKEVARLHARLDVEIFAKYISGALNICRRYVGEEPYDETTALYNEEMANTLVRSEIECIVVPRLTKDGSPVSASRVRNLIAKGNIDGIKSLVPKTTYEYFKNEAPIELLYRISNNTGRH